MDLSQVVACYPVWAVLILHDDGHVEAHSKLELPTSGVL